MKRKIKKIKVTDKNYEDLVDKNPMIGNIM